MRQRIQFAFVGVPVEREEATVFDRFAQRDVVFEKRPVDLGQSLQNRRIRSERLSLPDKCANDIYTHGDSAVALLDVRHLQRTVLGKGPWAIFPIPTTTRF
jgi:hypothetical protein